MAFVFRLETADGLPAEPPLLNTAVPNWSEGDCVQLGKRELRVIGKRDDDGDQPPVLVVEEA
jgi:hypothetical protein